MRKLLIPLILSLTFTPALAHGAHLEVLSIEILPVNKTSGFLKIRVNNHENTTNPLQAFASNGVKFTLEKKMGGVYQKIKSWPVKPGIQRLDQNTQYRLKYQGTFQKSAKGIPITVLGSGMVTTVLVK